MQQRPQCFIGRRGHFDKHKLSISAPVHGRAPHEGLNPLRMQLKATSLS